MSQFKYQSALFKMRLKENAPLQLVIALLVTYIIFHGVKVVLMIALPEPKTVVSNHLLPYLALQPYKEFITKPWIVLSYFWGHVSFWNLISNLIWLYLFGTVVQTFLNYKEIIPLFVVSALDAGLLYVAFTFFFPQYSTGVVFTALPGIIALATTAILLAPQYKFYLGERLGIPLWLILVIFFLLNILVFIQDIGMMILISAAALSGFVYTLMLKRGLRPGRAIYQKLEKIQGKMGPDPYSYPEKNRRKILNHIQTKKDQDPNEIIDKILDKINTKGYHSLSNEEKETLKKASEDISKSEK